MSRQIEVIHYAWALFNHSGQEIAPNMFNYFMYIGKIVSKYMPDVSVYLQQRPKRQSYFKDNHPLRFTTES